MLKTMFLSLAAALVLATSPANAQSHLDYLMAGNYTAARAALARVVGNDPEAPLHFAFLEALIQQREGNVEAAIAEYRRILAIQPHFEPARRELALLLARTGQTQGALYHAETLLATTQDRQLRASLEGFIASQSEGKPRGITTRFAILPSTNANGGTDADTVMIGGLPFTPDPSSQAQRATGISLGATAWNRWNLSENWTATLAGSVDVRRYDNDAVADETTASVRLDFGTAGPRHRLTFGPMIDRTWKDDTPFRVRLGLGTFLQYRLRPDLLAGANLSVWRQNHDDQTHLDGTLVSGALTANWIARPDLTLSVAIPFEVEKTGRDHLDHKSIGLGLALEKNWSNGLTTEFSIGYERDSYEGNFPLFGVPREDNVTTAGVSLRHRDLQLGRFIPELSLTYKNARSNIPFHDYEKVDLGLSFTQRF